MNSVFMAKGVEDNAAMAPSFWKIQY